MNLRSSRRRPIRANKEHGVSRLFVQELLDVCDALGLIQRSMEGKNFGLRSFPVNPPQRILNLSACLNLATESTIMVKLANVL